MKKKKMITLILNTKRRRSKDRKVWSRKRVETKNTKI